eukprot:CAMPEP_0175487152 /NCGR_PEP_ID=MMETSP0095-20121207/81392_1 /TAXON_ID=311494 /ORGANISM="Alexandrium monilatum, Strain CCMP3105" /LENGTH=115 /DNA_ID=CAMNT_0016788955 /DNA_START=86 /DNA_END=429 /DNA_ORIENTATION=+
MAAWPPGPLPAAGGFVAGAGAVPASGAGCAAAEGQADASPQLPLGAAPWAVADSGQPGKPPPCDENPLEAAPAPPLTTGWPRRASAVWPRRARRSCAAPRSPGARLAGRGWLRGG